MRRSKFIFLLYLAISINPAWSQESCSGPVSRSPFKTRTIETIQRGYSKLQAILGKIPYVFFTPLPRVVRPLNDESFQTAKKTIKAQLEVAIDRADGKTDIQSAQVSSNEQKLALVEAVREIVVDREMDSLPEYQKILDSKRRDLTRLMVTWPKGQTQVSAEKIKQYMDLLYVNSNDDFFRIKNLHRWVLSPKQNFRAWSRLRWEKNLGRENLKESLQELGLLHPRASKDRFWRQFKTGIEVVANLFVNYTSIVALGFPVWVPNTPFASDSLELTRRLLRKIYPLFVSAAIICLQAQTFATLNRGFASREIPEITNLTTREDIELVVRAEYQRSFTNEFSRMPSNTEFMAFEEFLKNLRIKELDAMAKKIQSGEKISLPAAAKNLARP